jgi:hypothetical protein
MTFPNLTICIAPVITAVFFLPPFVRSLPSSRADSEKTESDAEPPAIDERDLRALYHRICRHGTFHFSEWVELATDLETSPPLTPKILDHFALKGRA